MRPATGRRIPLPHAAEQIVRTKHPGGRIAECTQHAVTGLVAEGVVDVLEQIEIEDQHRGGLAFRQRPLQQPLAGFEERPPIGNASQSTEAVRR